MRHLLLFTLLLQAINPTVTRVNGKPHRPACIWTLWGGHGRGLLNRLKDERWVQFSANVAQQEQVADE